MYIPLKRLWLQLSVVSLLLSNFNYLFAQEQKKIPNSDDISIIKTEKNNTYGYGFSVSLLDEKLSLQTSDVYKVDYYGFILGIEEKISPYFFGTLLLRTSPWIKNYQTNNKENIRTLSLIFKAILSPKLSFLGDFISSHFYLSAGAGFGYLWFLNRNDLLPSFHKTKGEIISSLSYGFRISFNSLIHVRLEVENWRGEQSSQFISYSNIISIIYGNIDNY